MLFNKEDFMKKSEIVALLVSGVLVLFSTAAYVCAQDAAPAQNKCPFAGKKESMHQRFYEKLGLTDQQKKAWEENKAAQWKQMKALFGAMKEKREALKEEFTKDKLDMKKINQINGDLKKLAAQKIDLRLQRTLAAQKILTPEQFKQFIAKRHGYKSRHFGRGQGMMGNKSSLVVTSDGGVIVLKRHSLCKYDKDLNLIKEVKTARTKTEDKDKEEATQPQGEHH
jgi:Spy/CpxP family protein refolding chaperone